MPTTSSTAAVFIPPLRLKGEGEAVVIRTLDDAQVFAERSPHPEGDYDGMIRRLQGAHREEDRIEAANAFRWWCEANELLDESVG